MKQPILFVSHAAIDNEMASALKRAILAEFPHVDVFVSSDPESLSPGDPWIEKILNALENASLVIALTTERGLSRKWVWFESGRTWYSGIKLLTCCVGKVRKSTLPPPFAFIQGLNIDEPDDLASLFQVIENIVGQRSPEIDIGALARDLIRLDVRAEERNKSEEDPDAIELREVISKKMAQLPQVQRETIRQLLLRGEQSNSSIRNILQGSGQDMERFYVLDALARETGWLTQTHDSRNLNLNDQNAFKVTDKMAPYLREYFQSNKSKISP